MLLNCGAGEDSWESLGLQGDPTSSSWRRPALGVHWKDWCWSWNSNTLATWCEELTHMKRRWCWERLRAGREGNKRGWDGWMASPTQWKWVWVDSGSWWWTGRPGMLRFMGSQSFRHDWVTELNWTELIPFWGFPGGASGKKTYLPNTGDIRDAASNCGSGRSPGFGIATHSSILVWRIPWTEEPGRLQSIALKLVGTNLAHTHIPL